MNANSFTERIPYVAGAGVGLGAYLLGYVVSYVALSGSIEDRLAGFNFVTSVFGGDPINTWQAVGWLFYNAHFVRTRVEGGIGGPQSENFIAASDEATSVLLYLVPILLLLAAGFLLARYTGGEASTDTSTDEPVDGATVGVAVVLGYFPLAVIGAFLFSYQGSIAPDMVTAVLLAGLVYPLVFGATGGALGTIIGAD